MNTIENKFVSNDLQHAVLKGNVLTNVLDTFAGVYVTYNKIEDHPSGNPMNDDYVDGIAFAKKDNAYFMLNHDGTDIDVSRYGAIADGVFDNSTAFEMAANAALSLNVGIQILKPADGKSYNITRTVRIRLAPYQACKFWISSNGATIKPNEIFQSSATTIWKLTGNSEYVFFSIGPDSIWPVPDGKMERAFENNVGSDVSIIGRLILDASVFPIIRKPEATSIAKIAIPLQISAETIDIRNLEIIDCVGAGIRILGVKRLNISNSDFIRVGYRDKYILNGSYVEPDSYGEPIHIMAVQEGGDITISRCNLKGTERTDQLPERSRAGIVFEYGGKLKATARVKIDALRFDDFAKCFHVEQADDFIFEISNCEFLNFNVLIANTVNSPKYNITNCKVYLNLLDGNEELGGMPGLSASFYSNPQLIFKESDFYFKCESGKRMFIADVQVFENCRFFGDGKESRFYEGASTVTYKNCHFNNIGTLNSEDNIFEGWVGNVVFHRLIDCKIDGNENLNIKAGNQYLEVINPQHTVKNQTILTNKTSLIFDVLPYDPLVMVRTLSFPGEEFTINTTNMPSPLWDMYKFSAFVISANKTGSTRNLTRDELVKKEGYYLMDAIYTDQKWHQFSFTKIGTEPVGYEIVTINGGVTWRKSPGAGVLDLVVAFFPSHYKSFLI